MRLLAALTLAVAASAAPPPSMYIPYEPWELSLVADVIVEGTITELGTGETGGPGPNRVQTFVLRVDDWIVGEPKPTVTVRQFEDWSCAQRYTDYAVGQSAVFHLRWHRSKKGKVDKTRPLRVLGAGNEGEYVTLGKDHLVMSAYGLDVEREVYETRPGEDACGLKVSKKELRAATLETRRLFRHVPNVALFQSGADLRKGITLEDVEAFASSSELAGLLVAQIRECSEDLLSWRRPR